MIDVIGSKALCLLATGTQVDAAIFKTNRHGLPEIAGAMKRGIAESFVRTGFSAPPGQKRSPHGAFVLGWVSMRIDVSTSEVVSWGVGAEGGTQSCYGKAFHPVASQVSSLAGGEFQPTHSRGFLILVPLHTSQDVVEHADGSNYVWPFIEHHAISALRKRCIRNLCP